MSGQSRRLSQFSFVLQLIVFPLGGCGSCGTQITASDPAGRHEERSEPLDSHTEDTVRISPTAVKRVGITIDTVRAEVFSGEVAVPAEVQLDPDHTAHISPIVEGQVAQVRVSLGQRVEVGDPLIVMRSVALGETQADLEESRAQLDVAKAAFQRQQELAESGIGAKRNLVEAQGSLAQARARFSGLRSQVRAYGASGTGATVTIRSPIAGQVLQRHAAVGEVVSPGTVLLQIANFDRVWIMGQVYAQDVAAAQVNTPVRLSLRSVPGKTWSGTLDYVAPALEEQSRTLTVRVILDNEDSQLRPGLFGTLHLAGAHVEPIPTVVDTAIQEFRGQTVVFIPFGKEGEFHVVPVAVAHRSYNRAAIANGLSAGDRYVATGSFVLKSQLLRSELGHGHAH